MFFTSFSPETLIETRLRRSQTVQIGEALPQVFKRVYPVVQPSTEIFVAGSLLRFHEIDALPIEFKPSQKKRLAVFGYSCLSKLLETPPEDYRDFFDRPAKRVAMQLSTVGIEKDVSALLRLFKKTKFGFAWIESERLGGFAGLQDLLVLYNLDLIDTRLGLADIASPIFSLPKKASIRKVLHEMFARRIRRVFVEKTPSFVTDRTIIGHIFSPSGLEIVAKSPEALLDEELGDLEILEAHKVRGTLPVKAGAQMIRKSEECLVSEKGVVTAWDLVMKPLSLGSLTIKE